MGKAHKYIEMKIELLSIKELSFNTGQIPGLPQNPRLIKDQKFWALVKSLQEDPEMLALRELIVYPFNNEYVVIGGNMRLKAMQHLKFSNTPCKILDEDTPIEKLKAYTIKDNLAYGEMDWDIINNEWDIDELMAWGMDIPEAIESEKHQAVEDDFEIPDVIITDIKQGDRFEFQGQGIRHHLLCGDATDPETVASLMAGAKADMVFTDPPYNVNYSGRGKETSNKILNDKMSEGDFLEFLTKVFQSYKLIVKESAPFYICHSSSSQTLFEAAMRSIDLQVKNQIIWNKTVASMGWGDYRWKHEPIFYASFGKKAVSFYGDRSQYTVWNESWDIVRMEKYLKRMATKFEKGGSTIWAITRESKYQHPTQKPVELISIAIKNSSKAQDNVVDLFGGAGSTMVTAHQMRRNTYTLELDPKYVQVMVDRMRALDPLLDIFKNGEPY